MPMGMTESFDSYVGTAAGAGIATKWTRVTGSTSTCTFVTGQDGIGQAVQLFTATSTGSVEHLTRGIGATSQTGVIHFGFKTPSVFSHGRHFLTLMDSAGASQMGLSVMADGSIAVYRATGSGGGTIIAQTAPGVVTADTWRDYALAFNIHDSTGTVELYADDFTTPIASGGPGDTKASAIGTVTSVRLGNWGGNNGANLTFVYDNLYCLTGTTTPVGPAHFRPHAPSADVAVQFVPSTGASNYALVDEAVTNSDTDYVQGSTVGEVDTYDFADLAVTPSAILAVKLACWARKTDVTARTLALQAKSGATTSDGSATAMLQTYDLIERLMETDPNTGAAWTAAAVNALRGGPKIVS